MIRVSKVDVNWLETETFGNPMAVIYGGLVVHYSNGDVEGHVKLDYPENVAMNMTLSDIRKNVVLKLREVQ